MTAQRRSVRENHIALAQTVLNLAVDRGLGPGDHLPETVFANACGVSRTPIRSAFRILEEKGILERRPEEGYFLADIDAEQADRTFQSLEEVEDALPQRIVQDRAERRIGEVESVSNLCRRYNATRKTVLNALKILSQEDLVTQLPGRAWAFQPLVDSPRSLDESLVFRLHLEPLALLEPGFALDTARAGVLRRKIDAFLATDARRLSVRGFERLDIEFHSTLAEWSGNRFLRGSLLAHHRLRRASRNGSAMPAFRMRQAMIEHLDILSSLEMNQLDLAADQLTIHLRRSRIRRPEAANRGIAPLSRGARA